MKYRYVSVKLFIQLLECLTEIQFRHQKQNLHKAAVAMVSVKQIIQEYFVYNSFNLTKLN